MAQKSQTRESSRAASPQRPREGADAFKPLAIPAVAAAVAVNACANREPRKAARHEDLPAILRQDGFVD
jgi:hypothetical protein